MVPNPLPCWTGSPVPHWEPEMSNLALLALGQSPEATQKSCLWGGFHKYVAQLSFPATVLVKFLLWPPIKLALIFLPSGPGTIKSVNFFNCAYQINVYTKMAGVGGLLRCHLPLNKNQ